MSKAINSTPFLPKGWLRVISFLLAYFGCIVFTSFLAGSYLSSSNTKNSSYLFYVSILLSSIIALLLVFIFRRGVDRKSFFSLGWAWKNNQQHFFTGLLIGIAILCLSTALLSLGGYVSWSQWHFDSNAVFFSFCLMVVVAIAEELVFRGYILNNLMDSFPRWGAWVMSAILFGMFHGNNPGAGFLPLLNVVLAGLLLGINYIFTRNLWFGIGLHFIWNFLQGPVLGYKVSGITITSMLEMQLNGNPLLNGGTFGMEGSLLGTLFILLALFGLGFMYTVQEKNTIATSN